MFTPNVTIVTGDHRKDIPGCSMISLTDENRFPENNQNVIFCGENWIGSNVTITKGVKIDYGAVIATDSLVPS